MQNPIQKLINKLFEETEFNELFNDEFKSKLKTLLEYNEMIKHLYDEEIKIPISPYVTPYNPISPYNIPSTNPPNITY